MDFLTELLFGRLACRRKDCENALAPTSTRLCEHHLKKRRTWRKENRLARPDLEARRRHETGVRQKVRLMLRLGGLRCSHCGVTDFRVLTIDHIHGRPEGIACATGLTPLEHRQVREGTFDYRCVRVLCYNCNIIHEHDRGNRGYSERARRFILEQGGFLG